MVFWLRSGGRFLAAVVGQVAADAGDDLALGELAVAERLVLEEIGRDFRKVGGGQDVSAYDQDAACLYGFSGTCSHNSLMFGLTPTPFL